MGSKKFHVKFISKSKANAQSSLPKEVDPVIITCLYKIYPGLLIVDQVLDKLMWHVDDISLQFIYLICLGFAVFLILPDNQSIISCAFYLWAGYISLTILTTSSIYYIHTLWQELEKSEAPTMDEITHSLDSVLEKLRTLRDEALGANQSRKLRILDLKTTKLIIICSLFQYFALRIMKVRQYVIFMIFYFFVFHSVYYQSTMKLFWRSLWIRRIYYWLWKNRPQSETSENYVILAKEQVVPFPKFLQDLTGKELQVQLQTLIIQDVKMVDDASDYVRVRIIEYKIDENERKWSSEGWSHTLLPYERSHFCNSLTKENFVSPWKFQEELSLDWIWIDDGWSPTSWEYCDTEWNHIGPNESIESFTRTRTWKRRAFCILP